MFFLLAANSYFRHHPDRLEKYSPDQGSEDLLGETLQAGNKGRSPFRNPR